MDVYGIKSNMADCLNEWLDGRLDPINMPMNLEFVKDLWLPNILIYNLKTFKVSNRVKTAPLVFFFLMIRMAIWILSGLYTSEGKYNGGGMAAYNKGMDVFFDAKCVMHEMNDWTKKEWLDGRLDPIKMPMNLEFVKDLWLPNIFIYNLKTFKVSQIKSLLLFFSFSPFHFQKKGNPIIISGKRFSLSSSSSSSII